MAVTITTRFGITRWSHKDDVFSRQQMDDSHAAIEQYGAIFRQSDFSARPPAGMAGRFHYASDTLLLTYDDGVAWRDVLGPNTVTLTGTQTLTNKTLTAPVITGTIALPATTSIGNVSATEIGYVDGVTSAIQTQLNAKAPTSSPSFTGSVVLPSTTNIGTVSATELGFLDGVTSAIQTQINAKANTSHTHSIADVLTLQTALDAKGAVASGLNQFAATTSAQLAGVITDETGTGVLVYGTEPTLTLPYINNVRRGYTTTATSGGSTALTVNSNYQQFFTGSSIHDVQLPDVTTLTLGHTFCITNNGSATLTIKTFGSNVLLSLPGNTSTYVTCVAVTGTNTASWSAHVVGTGTITGTGASVLAVSPTLTGTPLAPTAPADTNNTQIASTAYVMGQAGAATPIMAGVAAVGTSLKFARQDHVHPADTTKVSGPSGSSTDTAIALYDGTGARLLKNSVVTIDASGNVAGLGYVNSGIWQGTAISATYIDAAIARVSALAPLLTPPSFEGVRTSTSTRTSSPWTINYTAETDPLGMLDTSTGGATLTAGLWLVAGHAAVTMAADSSAVQLIVMKDGVEGAANKTQLVNAGDYGSLAVSEVVRVTSTMSVWLSAVARSGITWYVNQAKFSVVKLGEL